MPFVRVRSVRSGCVSFVRTRFRQSAGMQALSRMLTVVRTHSVLVLVLVSVSVSVMRMLVHVRVGRGRRHVIVAIVCVPFADLICHFRPHLLR